MKRIIIASCVLGAAVGGLWPLSGFGFGEPRTVPDTSFYFNNLRWGRYPSAVISRVVSPDTVIAVIEGAPGPCVIRLAGIEGPTDQERPYDQRAVELLQEKILYRTVKLEGDEFLRTDFGEGPISAYIWLEGEQMNSELLRAGLARAIPSPYTPNIKYWNHFRGLEERARQEALGIWSL